jgi:hypothetical protein
MKGLIHASRAHKSIRKRAPKRPLSRHYIHTMNQKHVTRIHKCHCLSSSSIHTHTHTHTHTMVNIHADTHTHTRTYSQTAIPVKSGVLSEPFPPSPLQKTAVQAPSTNPSEKTPSAQATPTRGGGDYANQLPEYVPNGRRPLGNSTTPLDATRGTQPPPTERVLSFARTPSQLEQSRGSSTDNDMRTSQGHPSRQSSISRQPAVSAGQQETARPKGAMSDAMRGPRGDLSDVPLDAHTQMLMDVRAGAAQRPALDRSNGSASSVSTAGNGRPGEG